MNIYSLLPDTINLDAVKHIPLNLLPVIGPELSEVLTLAENVLDVRYATQKILRDKLIEHNTYSSRAKNRIVGKKPINLFTATSEFMTVNQSSINDAWTYAFGKSDEKTNKFIAKKDLTVNQTILITWLAGVSIYTMNIIELNLRIIRFVDLDPSVQDREVGKINALINAVNAERSTLRSILSTEDFVAHVADAPSTRIFSEGVATQLLDVLPTESMFQYDSHGRMALFEYTPGIVKPFDFDMLKDVYTKIENLWNIGKMMKDTAPSSLIYQSMQRSQRSSRKDIYKILSSLTPPSL